MRTRQFGSNLVTLPVLDAYAGLALCKKVLTGVQRLKKADKLPPAIAGAVAEVAAAYKVLQDAVARQPPETDGEGARTADAAEDNAWGALHDFLRAWMRLPSGAPQAGLAAGVFGRVFPEGLRFTLLKYAQEWSAAEAKLELIKKLRLDEPIVSLGGGPFLENLASAHRAYGVAVGMTAGRTDEAAEDFLSIREALDGVREALRTYVLRAAAHVQAKKPETAELAERLLAPIESWEGNGRAVGRGGREDGGAAPEGGPTEGDDPAVDRPLERAAAGGEAAAGRP